MSKLLILQPNQFTSFTSYYLEDFWRQFFDIEVYDSKKTYSRTGTAFVFWCANYNDDLPCKLQDQGYRVLIDNLWEYPVDEKKFYWIQHPYWFWLNESLWWQTLGHDQYCPSKNINLKIALMPVRRVTPERKYFVSNIADYLNQMIWSYGDKKLPNDFDETLGEYQRFVNFEWYNDSFCSIVLETNAVGRSPWLTEKIMRPMAFYHPYMILSVPCSLAMIRKMGFETFDNLFDESYDTKEDFSERCRIIIENLSMISPTEYDQITQEKLRHNRDHFYDTKKIKNIILEEIIFPIIDYADRK